MRAVFGNAALIQRCWLHKLRNLKKYVPDKLHGTLHWRMKKLMNLNSFEDAVAELQSLALWLGEVSQGAIESWSKRYKAKAYVHEKALTV